MGNSVANDRGCCQTSALKNVISPLSVYSFALAVDTDTKGQRVKESNDADGRHHKEPAVKDVSEHAALGWVSVAAAGVEHTSTTWFEALKEHKNVPRFANLNNAGTAGLGLIEILVTVDSRAAHLF